MKGYFLDLARLAHGTGPRLQPRPTVESEGEWTEMEGETVAREPLRASAQPLATVSPVTNIDCSVTNLAHESVTNESHEHPLTETHTTVFQEGESRIIDATIAQEETRTAEVRTTEIKESLRELVHEARTIRESASRETTLTEIEHATLATTREAERSREVERLVREVRENALEREAEREAQIRIERDGPAVEIHIGRIEVRALASSPSKEERSEKPKGVIDLNEYLRERSRGTS